MSFERLFPWILGARHSLNIYSEEARRPRDQSRIMNARKGEEQGASSDSPFPVLSFTQTFIFLKFFISTQMPGVRCFGCLVKYTGAHLFLIFRLILRSTFIGVKLRGMEGLMMSQKTSLFLLTYKLLSGIISSIKATALIFSCCYELKQDHLLMLLHAFCFCH